MIFLIRNWKYVLTVLTAVAIIGGVVYIRYIQDKIAIAEAELENNRIQQEALEKSLLAKGKNNAKTKTSDFNGLVSIHRNGGWLRVD